MNKLNRLAVIKAFGLLDSAVLPEKFVADVEAVEVYSERLKASAILDSHTLALLMHLHKVGSDDLAGKPEEAVAEEPKSKPRIDYTSLRKNQLKNLCIERKLSDEGNCDDLIARLVNSDEG